MHATCTKLLAYLFPQCLVESIEVHRPVRWRHEIDRYAFACHVLSLVLVSLWSGMREHGTCHVLCITQHLHHKLIGTRSIHSAESHVSILSSGRSVKHYSTKAVDELKSF
jgi:hypothetical protein